MLTPYLDMDWYARQLNRRSHVWKLSDQELDTVPPVLQSNAPWEFAHAGIRASIPPGYLFRNQLLVLRAIKDSFPNRPIYFSFGNYQTPLGLDPYVKRVGLVQKLEAYPVRESRDTIRIQNTYVDVSASLALWRTYAGPQQIIREHKWTDAASAGIPLYYAFVGRDLALALEASGDSTQARDIMDVAQRVANVLQ
jgi:hypothetical protein